MAAIGGVLAVGTQDGRVLVVEPATGETRLDVQAHRTPVSRLILSPDGSRVATASTDKSWRVWDILDGTQRLCVPGHDGKGACVCEPNGLQSWATIDAGCPVVGHARRVIAMAFAPDGERVATGGQDNAVVVWNTGTGQALLRLLEQHTQPVCAVAFSGDGLKLASGSIDEEVRVWNANTGAILHTLATSPAPVRRLQFSHDGLQLSCAWANQVGLYHEVFDLTGDAAVEERRHLNKSRTMGGPSVLAISPDGEFTAAAAHFGPYWTDSGITVRNIDVVNRILPGHRSFSRQRTRTDDPWVAGCTCRQGHPNPECPNLGHSARVTALAFSLDGAALASGSADKTVKIWEPGTGRLLLSMDVGVCVSSVTFGEDWVVGERRRERRVAFAMGEGPRLGGAAGCMVRLLKPEIFRMVLDRV
ncbi:WD40-repeat-containing domain protein [Baffinella frigidus]|nr:WD40-repeat-containing domain protein [Cryptophyta sp. CCMP2293]